MISVIAHSVAESVARASASASAAPSPNLSFITTWETTTASESITIPAGNLGTYNAEIDWGDGSPISVITAYNDANLTHTYAVAGTYDVAITGTFPWLAFDNGGDRLKIKDIKNWGDVGSLSLSGGYQGCVGMTCTAEDTPRWGGVTTLASAFRDCALFDGKIGGADTSSVTNMGVMFYNCSVFNQSVSNFDTSSVTDMRYMFSDCSAFNQSVSNFDTSSVTNMEFMFSSCSAFNQSVSNFDTSSVTDMKFMFPSCLAFNQSVSNFDTSSVTSMERMFYNCSAFNQSVSNFNTSSVTNMELMFYNCNSFDQDISGFNIEAVTNLSSFMLSASGLSTTNYDLVLVAWDSQAVTSNLSVHFGGSKYSTGGPATARANLVASDLWTIIDGGPA